MFLPEVPTLLNSQDRSGPKSKAMHKGTSSSGNGGGSFHKGPQGPKGPKGHGGFGPKHHKGPNRGPEGRGPMGRGDARRGGELRGGAATTPAPRVFGPKSPEGSVSLGSLNSSAGNTTKRAQEAKEQARTFERPQSFMSGGTGSRTARAHGVERAERSTGGAFGKGPREERGRFGHEGRGRHSRDGYEGRGGHEHGSESAEGITATAGSASRAAAARIVEAVSAGKSLSDVFVPYCMDLDPRDQAFVHEIVFGTLRQRRVLMQTLKPMFNYKITERHRIVQSLLLTALYQLVYMRVPAHAVVSSTVSACGECNRKSFASTVNAILRRFLREGATLQYEDEPAVKYSFPDWLADKLAAAYGAESAEIMAHSNEKPPLFLRVEHSKISTADYLEMLKAKEIVGHTSPLSSAVVRLEVPCNVTLLPGFNQGLSTVQDISAQLAAPLLELEAGKAQRVLDCCCAPGGKTAHILDLNPEADVTAIDIDAERLKQTYSTLERLGRVGKKAKEGTKVKLVTLDATKLEELEGEFDRILVDAPCSGTGVIRRHPDIKWLRRARDIPELAATQAKILDAAYNKLKAGGILLYTTCSVLPEENSAQIKAFLERHPEAQLKPFTINGVEHEMWQRLPGEDDGDGFFYARLQKPL